MRLNNQSVQELLQLNAAVGAELSARNIARTSNNPLGDVAEYLFSKAYGWELEANSKAGFDATNGDLKFQIKSRRVSSRNKSRQAGDIRNLDQELFDFLAGVVFDDNYDVILGVLVPHKFVVQNSRKITHTNSHRFYLKDELVAMDGVEDITERLKKAWASINSGSQND